MQIQWVEKGKKRNIALACALIAAAAQLAAGLWMGLRLWLNVPAALLLGGFTYVAFAAKATVNRWWGALIELACVAAGSFLILHVPLFHWMGMNPMGALRGVTLAALLAGVVFAAAANIKVFACVFFTFCWALSLIDAAVIEFSGNVITINDIAAIGTAMNVVGNYRFQVMPLMVTQLLLYVACMAAVIRTHEDRAALKKAAPRLAAAAFALLAAVVPAYTWRHKNPSTFWSNGIRRNSMLMEFVLELKTLNLARPEGYSAEAVQQLGEDYPPETAAAGAVEKKPHVIAIMIEAFSDLSVLGDLQTNIDYMPFTRQLYDQSVHGRALVSTLGGGTARSEWEFLTGNSMYFMPGSSMPFRQFMGDDENSIVRVYENAGYHTIGMHPFYGNGWGRNRVYPALGFDEIYFLDDLEWDEEVRSFVSDRAFVHQVINLFEHRDYDEPLFFFGVTMQNHSDYKNPDYPAQVQVVGHEGEFPAAEQYLTLIRETDDAIRELIEYFDACDEPVQIVFFGDHQPIVEDGFYTAVGMDNVSLKYYVPFVMWDNTEHRAGEIGLTSINFLATRLLSLTGTPRPAYFQFLEDLNQTVTAMDHVGYFRGDAFTFYGDAGDPDADEMIRRYNIYQYANMFDKTVDRRLFIGG